MSILIKQAITDQKQEIGQYSSPGFIQREVPGDFLNSKLSSSEISSHLTGRFVNLELYPFSFKEYLSFHKFDFSKQNMTTSEKGLLSKHFNEYINSGGFPEVVKGENPIRYASGLFHSIINRDILLRYSIKHQRTFQDIAVFLINNYAREISFNRIKNIFGLGSEHTAKNYVHYLEQAYLIISLSKFSFKKQETIRNRKSYVIDIAFIKSLTDDFSTNTGFIYENVVALELLRRKNFNNYELYYFKNKVEVDFVIRKNHIITELIQVSYNLDDPGTYKREVKALLTAATELKAEKLTIITGNMEKTETIDDKSIKFTPLIKWLIE